MLQFLLFFIVFVIISGMCIHHHTMNKMIKDMSYKDIQSVRTAAEHSIMASNTVNPIIALVEVVSAVERMEILHERYGPSQASTITGTQTVEILDVLIKQKDKILQDVMKVNTQYVPQKHPLSTYAGYA